MIELLQRKLARRLIQLATRLRIGYAVVAVAFILLGGTSDGLATPPYKRIRQAIMDARNQIESGHAQSQDPLSRPHLSPDDAKKLIELSHDFEGLNSIKSKIGDPSMAFADDLVDLFDETGDSSGVIQKIRAADRNKYPWLTEELANTIASTPITNLRSFEDNVISPLLGAADSYTRAQQESGIRELEGRLKALDIKPSAVGSEGSRYYFDSSSGKSIRFRTTPSKDGRVTTVMDKWLAVSADDLRSVSAFIKSSGTTPLTAQDVPLSSGVHIVEFYDPNDAVSINRDGSGKVSVTIKDTSDNDLMIHLSNAITTVRADGPVE